MYPARPGGDQVTPVSGKPTVMLWIDSDYEDSLVLVLHNEGDQPAYDISIQWQLEPISCLYRQGINGFGSKQILLPAEFEREILGCREDFLRLNLGRTRFEGLLTYSTAGFSRSTRKKFVCRVTSVKPA